MTGYLEGFLTGELIYMQYANTFGLDYCIDTNSDGKMSPSQEFCDELNSFLDTNELYLEAEIEKHSYSDYWYQVRQAGAKHRERRRTI